MLFLLMVLFAGAVLPSASAQDCSPTLPTIPLTDFVSGQTWCGFRGLLYDSADNASSSNTPPTAYTNVGLTAKNNVFPRNPAGVRDNTNGWIVVIGIGQSNMTLEMCNSAGSNCPNNGNFIQQVTSLQGSGVVNKRVIVVDCASGSHAPVDWQNNTAGYYSDCATRIANATPTGSATLTEKQVQVVLYKDSDPNLGTAQFPYLHALTTSGCDASHFHTPPNPGSDSDACVYEYYVGNTARFIKTRYTNIQQMFVQSRIYAGYSNQLDSDVPSSPEPFAYEYGFGTKWLVSAQARQIAVPGTIDHVAGDLSSTKSPWIGWGPYYWANGSTERKDHLCWVTGDYTTPGPNNYIHPNDAGIQKVGNMLINYYVTSNFSKSWFAVVGATAPDPQTSCP
jgi:hypothetical protein